MLTLCYYLRSARWMVPAGFMLGTAPTYYSVWGAWRILTSVLPTRVFEAGDEFLYGLYQRLILFFFENCSGAEILLYGDHKEALAKKENVIFICNHQSTVDWLVADFLAIRQGSLGNIRYILKDGLKYLPLYGYYFRQHSCVYVKRGGTFNETKADKQLNLFVRNKTPFWMVVFPEGTRYNPNLPLVIQKSQDFAQTGGFPVYEHVLCPRLKALKLSVDNLRPAASAIYDVTIAYSSTVAPSGKTRLCGPSLADFLHGDCSRVHIHLKRLDIKDVPHDEAQLQDWLMRRFEEKDKLLKGFYNGEDASQRGRFGPDGRLHRLGLRSTLPAFVVFAALNAPFFLTEAGRGVYWRLAIVGTIVSWVWVSVRN